MKTYKNIKNKNYGMNIGEVAVELLRVVNAVVIVVATWGRSIASCAVLASAVLVARAGLVLVGVI